MEDIRIRFIPSTWSSATMNCMKVSRFVVRNRQCLHRLKRSPWCLGQDFRAFFTAFSMVSLRLLHARAEWCNRCNNNRIHPDFRNERVRSHRRRRNKDITAWQANCFYTAMIIRVWVSRFHGIVVWIKFLEFIEEPEFTGMSQHQVNSFHLGKFVRLKFWKTANHRDFCLWIYLVCLPDGGTAFFLGNGCNHTGADYVNISSEMKIPYLKSIFLELPRKSRSFSKIDFTTKMWNAMDFGFIGQK